MGSHTVEHLLSPFKPWTAGKDTSERRSVRRAKPFGRRPRRMLRVDGVPVSSVDGQVGVQVVARAGGLGRRIGS
jgi:hypothetical protein